MLYSAMSSGMFIWIASKTNMMVMVMVVIEGINGYTYQKKRKILSLSQIVREQLREFKLKFWK